MCCLLDLYMMLLAAARASTSACGAWVSRLLESGTSLAAPPTDASTELPCTPPRARFCARADRASMQCIKSNAQSPTAIMACLKCGYDPAFAVTRDACARCELKTSSGQRLSVCVRLASTERATARIRQEGSAGRKIRHQPRPLRHPTASRERRNSKAELEWIEWSKQPCCSVALHATQASAASSRRTTRAWRSAASSSTTAARPPWARANGERLGEGPWMKKRARPVPPWIKPALRCAACSKDCVAKLRASAHPEWTRFCTTVRKCKAVDCERRPQNHPERGPRLLCTLFQLFPLAVLVTSPRSPAQEPDGHALQRRGMPQAALRTRCH